MIKELQHDVINIIDAHDLLCDALDEIDTLMLKKGVSDEHINTYEQIRKAVLLLEDINLVE